MGGRLVAVVEVGTEPVAGRDVEELLEGLLNRGDAVHVLQVGAETLELQGSPDEELVHAGGVLAKGLEHVGKGGVRLLRLFGDVGVLPENNLAMAC